MAAPYRDKHFLEMSDREREARLLEEMQRPGRDAIENVYLETAVLPAGRSALKLLRGILSPNKKPLPKVDMPGELYPRRPMPQKTGGVFKVKDIDRNAPTHKRTRQEIMLEKLRKRENEKTKEEMGDALLEAMTRAGAAAGFTQEQSKEYKKGGVVTGRTRGDGCVQRGKTRGKMR